MLKDKYDPRIILILLAITLLLYETYKLNILQLHMETLKQEFGREGTTARSNVDVSNDSFNLAQNDLLKTSNSTEYTWVGDQWVPPPGVPMYSPTDLLKYFQNRNVLFIGDSTSRRVWATAYAMMNATDRTNIPIRDLDIHAVVDFHKRTESPDRQCLLDDRAARKETLKRPKLIFNQYECRDLPRLEGDNDHSVQKKGKFDFTFYTCYSQVGYLVRDDDDNDIFPKLKPDYDLIIVGLGIWEIIHPENCDANEKKFAHPDRLRRLLENLQKQSSPDLQIMYRTCAFDARDEYRYHPRIADFSGVVKDFFNHANPNDNLTLVDWANTVDKRSFGEDRIKGDLPPHYGLQARTLFIQQLMHELMKAEAK